MITGTITTFLIQSSSAVTVITISLVNSGLMNLTQAIGIVLGTNIGTCITALLFTFDILKFYPSFLIIGFLMQLFKIKKIKFTGIAIGGFGLVFAGLISIQQCLLPLQESKLAISLLADMGKFPLTGIVAGAIFTAIIQSSSAVTGIIIALSLQGMISLAGGIALVLGSNIGTCVTAILASLTTNKNAKRVAYAHVFLNLFGVIIFYPFISWFAAFLTYLTPILAVQIVWGQILFNVISSLVALPFAKWFAKLITKF